jgi:CRP-like cAMP-binding protein
MASEWNRPPTIRNSILGSLAPIEFFSIGSQLEPVDLKERTVLQESRKRIEYVYFIEAGLVSLRTHTTGSILETAMVGRHGAVGASVAVGAEMAFHHSIMLVAGSALRIRVNDLRRLMLEHPLIRQHLLHYIQALIIQVSQGAFCGVRHGLEQRLACWLSIACDSLDRDLLPITHDHLSMILGLRRAGLTESLIRFEREGLIRKTRGFIQVRDRLLLKKKSCGCYGVISNSLCSKRATDALEIWDGGVSCAVRSQAQIQR